jgi:hypothetical protein
MRTATARGRRRCNSNLNVKKTAKHTLPSAPLGEAGQKIAELYCPALIAGEQMSEVK